MTRVSILGTGTMGAGMATNIVAAGHDLTVWNRTPRPEAVPSGAKTATSILNAVKDSDVVMYCLSDDSAVEQVAFGPGGVLQTVGKDTVVIDLSTISVDLSRRERDAYERQGVRFLDAPVFGSKAEAAGGGLWTVVGGEHDVFDHVRPVLEAISESVHYMGPGGSGIRMKLVGNLLVAAQLLSLAEAMSLAAASGLDLDKMLEVVAVTDFRTPIYSGVGAAIRQDDFTPSFALKLMHKDAGLIRQLSTEVGASIPGTETAADILDEALEKGLGDLNASALARILAQRAGVNLHA
ncbi:NAD(P)-dependent oxidoreductase [Pseudarthrobacter sp. NPDC080039]|uniref:NAD(P)-dependent oxidoreductase n=1 Tax=unclassified Pseudarthrobacter TaxID=2647000 RepID=UPI00344FE54A